MEKLARIGVLGLLFTVCCGCTLGPRALHPSQLWKWNRQDAWDEGTFSIPDPVDPRLSTSPENEAAAAPPAAPKTR